MTLSNGTPLYMYASMRTNTSSPRHELLHLGPLDPRAAAAGEPRLLGLRALNSLAAPYSHHGASTQLAQ